MPPKKSTFIQIVTVAGAIATVLTLLFMVFSHLFSSSHCNNDEVNLMLQKDSKRLKNSIANLQKIENNFYDSERYLEQPARYNDLIDYFYEVNPELLRLFKNADDITFVIGPAGCGKSYLLRELLPNEEDHVNLKTIRLTHTYEKDCKRSQLKNSTSEHSIEFCALPHPSDIKNVEELLRRVTRNPSKTNVLFIDDCDEFHPKAITELIVSINTYLAAHPNTWKFVLFGRHEAFIDYLTDPRREDAACLPIYLADPLFTTTGDVKMRVANYITWQKSHIDSALVCGRILNASDDNIYCFMKHEFRTLQAGNFIIEALAKEDYYHNLNKLKETLFNAYFDRSKKTHARALQDATLYKALLRKVAFDYMDKVDDSGFFEISDNQNETKVKICRDNKQVTISVSTKDLLEFSGLIDMENISHQNPRYRFYPFWIHRYLIENNE